MEAVPMHAWYAAGFLTLSSTISVAAQQTPELPGGPVLPQETAAGFRGSAPSTTPDFA